MSEFLNGFVQGPDGSWTCIRPCSHTFGSGTLHFKPGARFVRGQLVQGIDVVSFLDHRRAFAMGD